MKAKGATCGLVLAALPCLVGCSNTSGGNCSGPLAGSCDLAAAYPGLGSGIDGLQVFSPSGATAAKLGPGHAGEENGEKGPDLQNASPLPGNTKPSKYEQHVASAEAPDATYIALASLAAIAAAGLVWQAVKTPPVYCMQNVVFVPPASWQVSQQELKVIMSAQGCFTGSSLSFLDRILDQSGTGDTTHWPPACICSKDGHSKTEACMATARQEAEAVIFPIVRQVLEKSGVKPKDVDFLIVNCSIFTPTPSLCAMICHEFGMREDVRSYNLGGMGCSANVISVDLAKQLLHSRPGSRALVVSTENITPCMYNGNDKAMLLQNTLFRVGGVALLLSSRRTDGFRAKYELLHTIRTQMSDDGSYHCVFQKEDAEGNLGVALSKDIVAVAGRAMRQNFARLGPRVLSWRELAKVAFNRGLVAALSWAKKAGLAGLARLEVPRAYTPDFTSGIDHFCIHAGGRAVIDGVQEKLGLSEECMRPSKQTLYDWGNTSSSSIWYEAEWVERFGSLKKGDRILQVAFGSGFKCNTAVWRTLRVDGTKRGVPIKPDPVLAA